MRRLFLVWVVFATLSLIGETYRIYKAINRNWNPIDQAKVIYTVSACGGAGVLAGWFNI